MKKYPLSFLFKNSLYGQEKASGDLHHKVSDEIEVIELKPVYLHKRTIIGLLIGVSIVVLIILILFVQGIIKINIGDAVDRNQQVPLESSKTKEEILLAKISEIFEQTIPGDENTIIDDLSGETSVRTFDDSVNTNDTIHSNNQNITFDIANLNLDSTDITNIHIIEKYYNAIQDGDYKLAGDLDASKNAEKIAELYRGLIYINADSIQKTGHNQYSFVVKVSDNEATKIYNVVKYVKDGQIITILSEEI